MDSISQHCPNCESLAAENARLRGLSEPTEANVERVAIVMARADPTRDLWHRMKQYERVEMCRIATAALTAMGDV